jgi:hypothetical protein
MNKKVLESVPEKYFADLQNARKSFHKVSDARMSAGVLSG